MQTKCEGKYLDKKQIQILEVFIENFYNKGIPICKCDAERVISMYKQERLNRMLVTMGDIQFIALQNIIVNYKTGQRVEYSPNKIRKLYLNRGEIRDIQEQQKAFRK